MNTPIISSIQFVFDVESIGLHGEPFSVGYVVFKDGELAAANSYSCDRAIVSGSDDDRAWVNENVPVTPITHDTLEGVLDAFWEAWMDWKKSGAQMFAECAWPVEAKFLAMCIGRVYPQGKWDGPYPLHEIASFMAAAGMNPMANYDYDPYEVKHDPLSDAKQSARLLHKALERLGGAERKENAAAQPTLTTTSTPE